MPIEPIYTVATGDDLAGTPTVILHGEFDMVALPELRAAFDRVLAADPDTVHVDLADVSFIDSSALAVLVEVFERLRQRDGRLTVTAASSFAVRTLEISGLAPHLRPAVSDDTPTPTGGTPVAT